MMTFNIQMVIDQLHCHIITERTEWEIVTIFHMDTELVTQSLVPKLETGVIIFEW